MINEQTVKSSAVRYNTFSYLKEILQKSFVLSLPRAVSQVNLENSILNFCTIATKAA